MEYGEMLEVSRTGDKLAVQGNGAISRLIRMGMGSDYSHNAVLRWDRWDDPRHMMVDEMRELRGHRRSYAEGWFNAYFNAGVRVYHVQASDQVSGDAQRVDDWLMDPRHHSAKYGYRSLPLIPLVNWDSDGSWTPWVAKKLGIDPSRLDAVCSLFCQRLDKAMGQDTMGTPLASPGHIVSDPSIGGIHQVLPNRIIHQVPIV